MRGPSTRATSISWCPCPCPTCGWDAIVAGTPRCGPSGARRAPPWACRCWSWALAHRGARGVTVVDLDLAGLYASSELNAGGARATWWQPVNIDACRATLDFFAEHAEEFGFRRRGYLWLYDDADLHAQALEKRSLQNSRGLGVEALGVAEVAARFPVLD